LRQNINIMVKTADKTAVPGTAAPLVADRGIKNKSRCREAALLGTKLGNYDFF
jgi:hypothetical protein